MATLPQAKDEKSLKSLSVTKVRDEYTKLADAYNKIIDGEVILCHKCNSFVSRSNFYSSNEYPSGIFPICKKCLLEMVEQRKNKNDEPNETKESVQKVLHMMNLPYIDSLYETQCKIVANGVGEKNRKSPFLAYLVPLKSLPNWQGWTWEQSEFGLDESDNPNYDLKENKRMLKNARKRFGNYPNEDLMFLETEYQDWITHYEVNTKAQEAIFERLAFKKWEINKATREGKSTKDLDKTYTELLTTANVTPRQNVGNAFTESLTFGQMIERWEEEEIVPLPDPEFRDINGIGKLVTIFKGALLRALNLDGGYNKEYDDYLEQYTVHKPEDISGENGATSDDVYSKIFGSEGE